MMNWDGYGYGGMMGGGFGILATILWLVILVDMILLGIWLWKQVTKR